jgi:hypothetical protein
MYPESTTSPYRDEVCSIGKVLDSGFNPQDYALKGGVLNPSLTINGI